MNADFWKSRKAVGVWLLAVALVILAMVTVGGLTRLTVLLDNRSLQHAQIQRAIELLGTEVSPMVRRSTT